MKSICGLVATMVVLGWSGAAEAQARQRSTVIPGELRLGGGRRIADAIRPVLVRLTARIHHCYDAALRGNATLGGTLAVRFVIESNGVVSSATAGDRTVPDPTMVSCVMQTFMALRFPESMGSSTTATYTLRFVPGLTR